MPSRTRDEILERIESQPLEVLEPIADAIDSWEPRDDSSLVDSRLWSLVEPSPVDAVRDELSQIQLFLRRSELVTESARRDTVANWLGITPQAVSNAAADGRLLYFKHRGVLMFPKWQFDPDAAEPVVPGVSQVAEAFPSGVVTLSSWIRRPNERMGGQAPIDLLRSGRISTVVALARSIGS
jgi:hypothetical protein